MLDIVFPFGEAKVAILNHRMTKEGLVHHRADIRIKGRIQVTYIRNEIIDLVSRALEFDPLTFQIVGSRVAIEKGYNYYELHWNTTSGRS
jgi:hypothetical protein